jgi:hypothetical protein
MKCLLPAVMTVSIVAAPAFAQMEVTAALESETGQMATEQNLTAEAIHQKLAAECQGKVDVLVVEVIRGW